MTAAKGIDIMDLLLSCLYLHLGEGGEVLLSPSSIPRVGRVAQHLHGPG